VNSAWYTELMLECCVLLCRHHCSMPSWRNCPSAVAPYRWEDQYHTRHRSHGCSRRLYDRTSCLDSPWIGTGTDKWWGSVLLNETFGNCPTVTRQLWGTGVPLLVVGRGQESTLLGELFESMRMGKYHPQETTKCTEALFPCRAMCVS
jgi:hypothetical protein